MSESIEPNHLILITAGSGGSVIAGKLAIIQAGAMGVIELPLEAEYRKITWAGTDLELLALLELLAKAGYITAQDFKRAASHMEHHFAGVKAKSVSTVKSQVYPDRRKDVLEGVHQRLLDALEALL